MIGSHTNETRQTILFFGNQSEGEAFATLVSPRYPVLTAANAEEAKLMFKENRISVAITEHKTPPSALQELIRMTSSRSHYPTRWILTGNASLDKGKAAAQAAQMHHYIQQPWQINEIRNVLDCAVELAAMQDQNKQLNDRYQKELTESRQHEAALEISEERMKLALQTAQFGIWDWDIGKNELTWDPSMFEIFGVKKEEFNGAYEAWEKTVHPDDLAPANAEVQQALKGEKPFDTEFRILRFGKIAYIRGIGKVSWDENGNPKRMLGVNYDITHEREAEAKLLAWKENLEHIVKERTADLLQARDEANHANQAKSNFLSRMSHELRTPLNSIIGFSHLLLLTSSSPDQKGNAERIYKAGKHLLILVNDVLDISKIESGNTSYDMTSVDIRALILEVFEMMSDTAKEKGISLKPPPLAESPILVLADDNRLRQVLLNLVSNGIKYNRPHGELEIDMEQNVGEKKTHIHVCDTGSGIPEDKHHRLFTPFDRLGTEKVSTSIEGTGLGLALSKCLVEGMLGDIRVTKSTPEGSVFTVTLNQVE